MTNRKGGVGKSTISTHLAAGMAARGWNVAIVDTDSQGHASLMLGMDEENGLFRLMIDKAPFEEVLRFVPPEHYSPMDNPSRGNLFPAALLGPDLPDSLHAEAGRVLPVPATDGGHGRPLRAGRHHHRHEPDHEPVRRRDLPGGGWLCVRDGVRAPELRRHQQGD
ncbi:MAG: AAA family ATPase [Deltaproteobacteria bacterium]|nr:AAA family ATPase [Deltaproteobacteria bacterium]